MEFKIYVLIIFSLEVSLSKNLNKPRPLKNTAGTCYIEAKKLSGRRGKMFLKNC